MSEKKVILYLGQKEIGERCFRLLYEQWKQDKIELIVSSNTSDNVWWRSNYIYETCHKEGIPFFSNERKDDRLLNENILKYGVNQILSVQHNWILKRETLQMVDFNALNLHLAKLPEYQGYCTFNHAIMNQEYTYGVTLHWMTEKVDSGDVGYQKEFAIEESDTAYSLYQKSVLAGENCFRKLLDNILRHEDIPRIKMTGSPRFYTRESIEAYKEIKELDDKSYVARTARACWFPPFEPAYFTVNGEKIFLVPELNKE